MLDVHPPHQAAHSWKDFLIHIATIVIGLLIAIGLEQSVEWAHHRNELRETLRALALERRMNVVTSVARTKEYRRELGKLQTDLAIFEYLAKHPGAPASEWPGKLSWTNLSVGFDDAAWQLAVKSNVTEYMSHAELLDLTELYGRTNGSNDSGHLFIMKARGAVLFAIREPDPSKLTPQQIDQEIDLLTDALYQLSVDGTVLVNLSERYPDFSSPSRAEVEAIRRISSPPEDVKEVQKIRDDRHRKLLELENEHPE
jgi:hypothetical protein